MTTWKAFWAAVFSLSGAIFIGPQPNIVFHAIGVVLFAMAVRFWWKFTMNWKRDLMGKRGSQAMYAQRMAQPQSPTRKPVTSANMLSFKQPDD